MRERENRFLFSLSKLRKGEKEIMKGYKKVRLTDENGLNGETAWAYGRRETKHNYEPYNLSLILDNETAYFSVGTELILKEDQYNVDMEKTKELADAKAIIKRYHGWTREKDATSKVARQLIRKHNLSFFLGKTLETAQGAVKFVRLENDEHDSWLVGKNLHTEDEKRYSDVAWISAKLGYAPEDIDLILD